MSTSETEGGLVVVAKRFGKWVLVALLAFIVLFALVIGAGVLTKQNATPLTSYAGVTIGESRDQVRYALGAPETFMAPNKPGTNASAQDRRTLSKAEDPLDFTVMESPRWFYDIPDKSVVVAFDESTQKVAWVSCGSRRWDCPIAFNGIRNLLSEDEVVKRLGKPDSEEFDGATKIMGYDRLNLTLYLEKRSVYIVRVGGRQPPPAQDSGAGSGK